MHNQPRHQPTPETDNEIMHMGIGGCGPVPAARIESGIPQHEPMLLPGSRLAWQPDGAQPTHPHTGRSRPVWIALALCVMCLTSCKKMLPDHATLVAFNVEDPEPAAKPAPPAPPPRFTVDIIVDTASTAAAKPNVEEVVSSAVDFVAAQDPRSEVRLWVLDEQDAQLMNRKDISQGGWVDATGAIGGNRRSGDATLQVGRLLAALSRAPRTGSSPIAEALTKVGLSPPDDRGHWLIIVVTDGIEDRGNCPVYGYAPAAAPAAWAPTPAAAPAAAAPSPPVPPCQPQFNCAPPDKATWFKYLTEQRLLPSGSLAGAAITFAYFEPIVESRGWSDSHCLASMAFVQALQDLWRTALADRAGARVAFALRAPTFPSTTSAAALPAVATKEAQ